VALARCGPPQRDRAAHKNDPVLRLNDAWMDMRNDLGCSHLTGVPKTGHYVREYVGKSASAAASPEACAAISGDESESAARLAGMNAD
jgi:hypothetical protein